MLSVLMIVLMIVSVSAVSAATIFSDNFNDDNLNGWSYTSSYDVGTSDSGDEWDQEYAWIEDDAKLYKQISTAGYENINFAYCRRTYSAGSNDELRIGWKTGSYASSCGSWNELEWVRTDTWSCVDFDLLSSADDTAIYIAFYMDDGEGDDGRVDNVVVSGDVIPEPEVEITVVAHKIVCDSESDLPNWGGGGASITSSTATDYVANNQNCHLQSGWDFQWRFGGSNPGDNNDCVGSGWTTFGSSTDGNGMTSTTIDNADSDTLWFRECLKSGYVQFSDSLGDDNTAEFYCNGDVLNYDNYDNINDAISNGDTFYCVAFNAELECVEDSDCAPDNNYCDGSFWVHYSESCVDNECLPASSTADCNDGLFCNGEETCTGEAVCVPGTDPCDDGDVCEDTCDDDQDTCTYDVDDITGPETDGMTIDPVYNNGNFELDATSEDECSYVASAEYFVGQGTAFCGDDGTGYAMDAVDASFDELLEEIWEDHVNSPVTIQDGQNFVCIKAKDSLGNLGNCACKYFESDTIPPERVFDIFLNGVENPDELLICDNDPTLCLTICDSESDIQGGEYFLNMLIPPEDIPAPWSGYWLESCIQYMDVGWHCADLTATIPIDGSAEGIVDNGDGNFEPAHPVLAEGTHYINQIRGKDIVENWGKIWNQNFGYSFIIDREAPIITKELLPVDDLAFSCQWTEMMGHQLTHGCQYVKSGTQVHLSADDSTFVDDHEFAGDVIIYYKVYWSYDGSSWELVQEEQSGVDQELYITLSEDSFHLVEFWAVDGCGHETEHYFELDVVDTLEPVGIKTIGAPNISCESMGDPECDYWVRDHVTEITLDCVDQDPHPVGGEILYYKISFDDPQTPWLTRDYCAAFGGTFVPEGQGTDGWCVVGVSDGSYTFVFTEDSLHDLEFYCEDALGNANQVDLEYFKVDSVPPTTTKTY